MFQFLSSYWYLLLIFIIVVVLIVKKLIKTLVLFSVFVIVCVIVFQIFISSGFDNSTACFIADSKQSEEIYPQMAQMKPGQARDDFICSNGETQFQNLIDCFKMSKESNKLSFYIYSNLPWFKNPIAEIVSGHNKVCPNNQLTKPVF